MKFLAAIAPISLGLIFLFSQDGTVPVWAEEESTKEIPAGKAEEAVATVEIPEKKPEGMSDLDWEKLKAKKPLPFDKGPSEIDVSKYPKEMQDIYNNIFTKTCSKCHTIARAINAPMALPKEWMNYIKKMMKKPGSGIDPNSAKKIHAFLVYDSSIRKKDIIEEKLKEKAETGKKGRVE